MVRQAHNSVECPDDVELRFERQPVDVVRAAGLEFRQIDDAAIEAAAHAPAGESFVAAVGGWGIHCEQPRPRLIRVVRLERKMPGAQAGLP